MHLCGSTFESSLGILPGKTKPQAQRCFTRNQSFLCPPCCREVAQPIQDPITFTAVKPWGTAGCRPTAVVASRNDEGEVLRSRVVNACQLGKTFAETARLWRLGPNNKATAHTGGTQDDQVLLVAAGQEDADKVALAWVNRSAREASSRSVGVPRTPGSMPGTPIPGTPIPWEFAGPRAAPQTPPGIAQARPLTPRVRAVRIQFLVDRIACDAEELRALLREA